MCYLAHDRMIVTLTPLPWAGQWYRDNNNIMPGSDDAETSQCKTCGTRGPGFLSFLIYWPIFPPLDCVSYQWLDICYIWIIASRGSNVILMTEIHQGINVRCQPHAESGIKKSEPGKRFTPLYTQLQQVRTDKFSIPWAWDCWDSLFGWPTLRDERWMSGRDLRWPEVKSNNDLRISFQSPTFPAAKARSIKTFLLTINFSSLINFAIKWM